MRLDIKDLNVAYETTKVLKKLSLCVKEGEFFTILGHSGSGKSTILKAVAGLIESSGTITLGDVDISQLAPEQRNIAYVFQKPLLFPHLSVSKNITFGLEIHKWSKSDISARVNELLELLFIKDLGNRMPNELSGGQQQRVAIARALALNPSIILMDEPFSSLDPELRSDLGELLKGIQQKLKLTIVFVTHDSYEALRLSDTIAFLEDGVVLQEGNSEDLFSRPKSRVVGDFFGKGNYITRVMSDIQQVENNQLLYIRPHDIEIREVEDDMQHNEVIISHGVLSQVHKIGKECRLTFRVKGGTIFVEYFGSKVFNVEANYNLVVNSNKLHYI